jgi:lysophospholipase L1-like esterase
MKLRNVCLVIALLCFASVSFGQSLLKDGDKVAICGDSITEQKLYSVFIEDYLLMCQPTKVQVMQFGWGGETASGFAARMKGDVLIFKPTFATTCYGMNDGGYRPIDDMIRQKYRESMTKVVDTFAEAGTRVLVGTPGAVDTETFKRPNATSDVYNENLAALGEEAAAIAKAKNQAFVDVHAPMLEAMKAAKAKLGEKYAVAGTDGVHPGDNGHIVMAYAFLKGMQLDGDVGTIVVDLASKSATTKGDHRIIKVDGNEVTVESKRYPFCFPGELKPGSAGTMVQFFPFNKDLNRLMLKVDGATGKYKVTWGKGPEANSSKEYTADELKAGVNLAADFVQNPFVEAFAAVDQKVREKQAFETKMFKGLVHSLNDAREQLKQDEAIDGLVAAVKKRHAELTAAVTDAVKPVTHTIKIEPIQ